MMLGCVGYSGAFPLSIINVNFNPYCIEKISVEMKCYFREVITVFKHVYNVLSCTLFSETQAATGCPASSTKAATSPPASANSSSSPAGSPESGGFTKGSNKHAQKLFVIEYREKSPTDTSKQ